MGSRNAYLALAAVCFFWGTTYLGIRMALETLPPFVIMSARFLCSGAILLIAARSLGAHIPRGSELFWTAVYGILPLGVANGALTFAETWISSSLAALFITTAPFWLVGLEALIPGGERLRPQTAAAMTVGLLGVVLLVAPDDLNHGISWANITGFLLLQVGNFAWSAGSILFRRRKDRTVAHPVVSGAIQQFATGLVMLVPALTVPHPPIAASARSIGAVVYLIFFGSIVGYSAYIYVMDKLPVSLVSIYTYVNPLVAVALGWLIYREPFGWREAAAMSIIFLGVYLVKRTQIRPQTADRAISDTMKVSSGR